MLHDQEGRGDLGLDLSWEPKGEPCPLPGTGCLLGQPQVNLVCLDFFVSVSRLSDTGAKGELCAAGWLLFEPLEAGVKALKRSQGAWAAVLLLARAASTFICEIKTRK